MKKRFTVMLDEKVIQNIKQLNRYWTPSAVREEIETTLGYMAEYHIQYEEMRKQTYGISNQQKEKKDE